MYVINPEEKTMIRFLKLVTGEEIVGVIEEKEASYFVKWPVKLSVTQLEPDSKPTIKVDLFAAQIKGHSVDISKSFVLFIGEPTPELKEYYDNNFGKMVPQPATAVENEG